MFLVPQDIAIEIFSHCLPDEDFPPPHPLRAPLLLCHVCSSWRSMALACPLLWSKFLLYGPSLEKEKNKIQYAREKLSLWGRNSEGVPLDVFFWIYRDFPEPQVWGSSEDNKFLHELTAFLITNSSRIRRLCLLYEDYKYLEPFFALPDTAIPALECLYLHNSNDPVHDTYISLNAPNLRRVILDRSVFLSPLDQLTHLIVQELMPISSFASILSDCQALVRLSMSIFIQDVAFSELPQRRITSPCLKTLSLTFEDIDCPSTFDPFDFPILETLRIWTEEHFDRGMLQFLPETAPKIHFFSQLQDLRQLTLTWQAFTAEMLVSLLRLTPFLEELVIASEVMDYRAFIIALTHIPGRTAADGALLPNLQSLTLFAEVGDKEEDPSFFRDKAFKDYFFIGMLISRCPIYNSLVGWSSSSSSPRLLPLRRVDLWIECQEIDHANALSLKMSRLDFGQIVVKIHKYHPIPVEDTPFSEIVPFTF